MKQIPLTQGQFVIVDDKNYEWLNQWKWHAWWNKDTQSYYAVRSSKKVNGKQHNIYMAREILKLKKGDKCEGDHINHDTLDNRESNLRIVTHQQNHYNRKNVKGYYWCKKWGKYVAQIRINGKVTHLGSFLTMDEARNTYLVAKEKYHKI